jgi:hypothetical protein
VVGKNRILSFLIRISPDKVKRKVLTGKVIFPPTFLTISNSKLLCSLKICFIINAIGSVINKMYFLLKKIAERPNLFGKIQGI